MPDEDEKITTHRANAGKPVCHYHHDDTEVVLAALRAQDEELEIMHGRLKGLALLVALSAVWVIAVVIERVGG